MSVLTNDEAIAAVCHDQHYYEAGLTGSGTKYWMCVRCAHIKPFALPAPRQGE